MPQQCGRGDGGLPVSLTGLQSVRADRLPAWVVTAAIAVGAVFLGTLVRYVVFVNTTGLTGLGDLIVGLCQFDCAWFGSVIERGYDEAPLGPFTGTYANWAFFPLYPTIAGALAGLFDLRPGTAGFLLSSLCTALALFVSRPLFGERGRWAHALFCVLLTMGPYSFYFQTLYSESLFVLLTVGAFVLLRRGNYLGAGALGALMSATRIVGVLFVFAMLVQAFIDHRRRGGLVLQFPASLVGKPDILLGLLLAPLGLFVFMAYLHALTGDALAFSHIQWAWGREIGNPLSEFWRALTGNGGTPLGFIPAERFYALCAIFAFAMAGFLFARGDRGEALFVTLAILAALSTSVFSLPRFVVGLAPVMIMVSLLLGARWWLAVPAALLAIASGALLSAQWFLTNPVLV